MALHGKQSKTERQKRARGSKASRAKRYARRWDERVEEMKRDLAVREAAKKASESNETPVGEALDGGAEPEAEAA